MAGKKSAYLCALLCVTFTLSILISDVNARVASNHRHQHGDENEENHETHPHPSLHHRNGKGASFKHKHSKLHLRPYKRGARSSYSSSTNFSLPFGSNFGTNYGSNNAQPSTNFGTNIDFGNSGLQPSQQNAILNNMVSSFGTASPGFHSGSSSGSSGSQFGSVTYPQSNGYSGNSATHQQTTYTQHNTNSGMNTQVYISNTGPTPVRKQQYIYKPPTIIRYSPPKGESHTYPVYSGTTLPGFIYDYKSSDNRYRNLLTGLALYNLGRITANSNSQQFHSNYKPKPDERCKFGVKYMNGHYEEMAIECWAITYFIYEDEPQLRTIETFDSNNNRVVTTQYMFANGSLVQNQDRIQSLRDEAYNNQKKFLSPNDAQAVQKLLGNGQVMSVAQQFSNFVTTNIQAMPVTDPRLAGVPVEIKPDMQCYVLRSTGFNNMNKTIPCQLLQKYSTAIRNSGDMIKSSLTIIMVIFALLLNW